MSDRPEFSFEVLIEHTEWIARFARALLGDEHRAEDAVQQTWLHASQRAPRHSTNVRGWLTVVLRNVVRRMGHLDARRRRVDVLVCDDRDLASPDEIAERVALQRFVSGAVLDLPAQY